MKNCSQSMRFYTNHTLEIVKKLNKNHDQKNNSTTCPTLIENLSKEMVKQCDNEQNSTISKLTQKMDDVKSECNKTLENANSEFNKKLEDAKKRNCSEQNSKISELNKEMEDAKW